MNKQRILAKVLQKLAILEEFDLNDLVNNFKDISESPEKIKQKLREFEKTHQMSQQEKLKLIWEIKKKGLIKKDVPGVDEAWRAITKEWKVNVRLWG